MRPCRTPAAKRRLYRAPPGSAAGQVAPRPRVACRPARPYHPRRPLCDTRRRCRRANPLRLFVTHAWENSDDYLRVFEYLESARNFFYRNYQHARAAPERGQGGAARGPARARSRRSRRSSRSRACTTPHQDLLTFQLLFAQASQKPVVLMKPFGARGDGAEGDPRISPTRSSSGMSGRWSMRCGARRGTRIRTRCDTIEFKLD